MNMKTQQQITPSLTMHPLISQEQRNSCTWIGHLSSDPDDHFAGQTFTCPREARIDNIRLFLSDVRSTGEILVSVHEFLPENRSWGPAISSGHLQVDQELRNHWVDVPIEQVLLAAGKTYAFKLAASNAMVAIAEAAQDHQHPFDFGQEWNAETSNQQGRFYQYFSLTFQLGKRA